MPSVALYLLLVVTISASAWAQTQAGVTGVVSDESGAVLQAMNMNYSGTGEGWLQPQSILAARLLKPSVQFDY